MNASSALPASALVRPLSAAIDSMSCVLFIDVDSPSCCCSLAGLKPADTSLAELDVGKDFSVWVAQTKAQSRVCPR